LEREMTRDARKCNVDPSEFSDNPSDAREATPEGAPFPGTGGEYIGTAHAGDGGGYPRDLRTGGGIPSRKPRTAGAADDTADARADSGA
jgi:hypothetical protein